MPLKRTVYLLDPQKFSPETIAVTFAKTSRSPQSFQDIASELTEEKSAQFHEKWVVGYGHSSVAEHAVLHIAVENISRLAVESLESNRLASYTEKSTRYQKWDEDSFYVPEELNDHPLRSEYLETNNHLFQAYQQALPAVQEVVAKQNPRRADESESAWERRLRSDYVDVCRFFLPASSLANVGITINARALEHAIRKMLSHPLEEVRRTGEEIKVVAQENVPTLVKYADEVTYWKNLEKRFSEKAKEVSETAENRDWCQLVRSDNEIIKQVLAAVLYRFGSFSYTEALQWLDTLPSPEMEIMVKRLMAEIKKFEIPPRELEYGYFIFELLMDQGAFFEIKRHRMMTQTAQPLSTSFGYAVPRLLAEAGMDTVYHQAMEKADQTYRHLAEWNPHVASYVVPNGFNRSILMQANLRSLDHLIALRSAKNAHFSVRRLVHRMAEVIQAKNPLLKHWLREEPGETWQDVESQHFIETMHMIKSA